MSERQWLSIEAAAEYLSVSTKTIRRYIASGDLTGYRAGPRLIRIDRAEIDAMLSPIPDGEAADVAGEILRGINAVLRNVTEGAEPPAVRRKEWKP